MDIASLALQLSTLLYKLGERIKKAIEQHKGLAKELKRCEDEVDATSSIINLVRNEPALQTTTALATAIKRLQSDAETLNLQIKAMGKKRGTVKSISHQLVNGTEEQQALVRMIEQLVQGKLNLQAKVQLVHVGLTRETQEAIAINTRMVQRIDSEIQKVLGPGRCLVIAAFVQAKMREKHPDANGILQLTWAELKMWTSQMSEKQRMTEDCHATGDALQLNAPIEVDLWDDVPIVKIIGCTASDRAIQSNYIQTAQTLEALLAARKDSIAVQFRR